MKTERVVVGVVLIAVAIWMFARLQSPTARYLGGAIVAIIGLAILIPGCKPCRGVVVKPVVKSMPTRKVTKKVKRRKK